MYTVSQVSIFLAMLETNMNDSLCVPNKGNTPPNVDRTKLLAAKALAAKVGYASTRKVKIPEYTRMVLGRKESF